MVSPTSSVSVPKTDSPSTRIETEATEPGSQAESQEITDSLYEAYQPQRVKVKGAKPHPEKLVQSAAMASVKPPVPTYKPTLPAKVISDGLLSLPQLEAVIYAGQAHEAMLSSADMSAVSRSISPEQRSS